MQTFEKVCTSLPPNVRLALKQGLEHQESVFSELKGDFAELLMQIEKIQVQRSISYPKPLTATTVR
jgi:hypothetical protein